MAILFISHDLSVVRQLCGRVFVMRSGVVVEQGDIEDVASDPQHEYTRALIEALPGKHYVDALDGEPHAGVAAAADGGATP